MTGAPIEVLAIRRLDGKSAVKAFVDVRVGGLVLKGGKIVCQEGQRPWYATPSVKTDHGWQQVVEIASKDLRQRITDVVLAAWQHDQERVPLPERGQRAHDRARDAGRAQQAGEAVVGAAGRDRPPEPPRGWLDDHEAAVRDLERGPSR